MNKVFANFDCALAVVACVVCIGCDSSTSSNAEDVVASSSSVADNLSMPASVSSSSAETLSSSAVESSSSVAVPTTLCKISVVTQTGYYPMAYTIGKTWICAPLENCDVSAVNTGFAKCLDGHATVEGCYSEAKAEVVEKCDDDFEESCETRNGMVYTFGRLKNSCSLLVR